MSLTDPRALRETAPQHADVVVVGGGQAALAVAYYLRRTSLRYVLLDDRDAPGGAWRSTWDSLRLFSPALWSSLPGYLMPGGTASYPTRDEVIDYLTEYERRYDVPVVRPVHVATVRREGDRLSIETSSGTWSARAVVSATGTWAAPHVPRIPGEDAFRGTVVHSAHYASPDGFTGQRVVVVGGGNSGAQIVADLHERATVSWATLTEPTFLPDEIDGRYLFEQATARYQALAAGRAPPPFRSLGDVVAVEPVRRAREHGALATRRMFVRYTADGVEWPDGSTTREDAVILATGFAPALGHLDALGITRENGRIDVERTRAVREPRLWLVGYGDWTGFASATLIGVGRSARETVAEVTRALDQETRAASGGQ